MYQEMFLLRQLLGGTSPTWICVALLASLFLVLILRPERIRSRGLFKAACALLALSIIVPSALECLLLLVLASSGLPFPGPTGSYPGIVEVVRELGPMLLGAGVFLGLMSLIPPPSRSPFPQPPRHPLE